MTWQRFLVTAALGLAVATAALVLAAVLDADWLRFVAVAAIVAIFVAREAWAWRGSDRSELLWVGGALLVAVAFGFIWQKLVG